MISNIDMCFHINSKEYLWIIREEKLLLGINGNPMDTGGESHRAVLCETT